MPEQNQTLAVFELKFDGQAAASNLMDDVVEVTVENSIHLPDVCTIRLFDAQFEWLESETLKLGGKVQVLAGYGKANLQSIFQGEITALEADLDAQTVPTFVVRCFDLRHRLHRGRKRRTFVNVTDSDVVTTLATEAGLTAVCDATTETYDWLCQNNQTNWEFLWERTVRSGYQLYIEGETKLHFSKLQNNPTSVSLSWGEDLLSFRPRISASPQVNKVTVRGWDVTAKQAIVGTSATANGVPEIGFKKTGGAAASEAFSAEAEMVVIDRPVFTQSEANALAISILDDIGGEFVEADGLCLGNPELVPQCKVQITNVGTRFSGSYYVTSTTHVYSPSEGYSTMFSISGKRPGTLLSLLEQDFGGKRLLGGGSVVVGLVTNNKDDKNMGRVKVKYPCLDETLESDWVRIATPMAGGQRGFYFLPEIDDEVLVAFEYGDIRRPYIIGMLWNGKDKPMENSTDTISEDGKVIHRIIKTRSGHTFLFDDTVAATPAGGAGAGADAAGAGASGADAGGAGATPADGNAATPADGAGADASETAEDLGEIKLMTKSGHYLSLNSKDKNITVKTKDGRKLCLDDENQKIEIVDKNEKNKMTILSTDNSITIECVGDFTVNATGKAIIKGTAGVEISTPAQVKVEGKTGITVNSPAQVQVQGNASVDIKSPGRLNLQGDVLAALKSTTLVQVQGTLVKIN